MSQLYKIQTISPVNVMQPSAEMLKSTGEQNQEPSGRKSQNAGSGQADLVIDGVQENTADEDIDWYGDLLDCLAPGQMTLREKHHAHYLPAIFIPSITGLHQCRWLLRNETSVVRLMTISGLRENSLCDVNGRSLKTNGSNEFNAMDSEDMFHLFGVLLKPLLVSVQKIMGDLG